MLWQPEGGVLAVKIDRQKKAVKTSHFEFFRVRERDIPVEALELGSQSVVFFRWEPKGNRFALILADASGASKNKVAVYEVQKSIKLLKQLEEKSYDRLEWSPRGSFLVFVGVRQLNGAIEFYNADTMTSSAEVENFFATDFAWDPSGRYLCTWISAWKQKNETGYTIWSFRGKQIHRVLRDHFCQFAWRPRPPSLLSAAQEREIGKNLRVYAEKYEKEDASMKDRERQAAVEKRRQLRAEFQALAESWKKQYEHEHEARRALRRPGYFSSDEDVAGSGQVEEIEEVIEEIEEEVSE